MIWTDEKIATLTAKWLEGVTSPEIAALVGASEGAVRGKRSHLGLPSRAGEAAIEAFKAAGRARRSAKPAPPKAPPAKADLLGPLPGSRPKPWLQRGIGECAFPVGGESFNTLSCCEPVGRRGADYCGPHELIRRRRR